MLEVSIKRAVNSIQTSGDTASFTNYMSTKRKDIRSMLISIKESEANWTFEGLRK